MKSESKIEWSFTENMQQSRINRNGKYHPLPPTSEVMSIKPSKNKIREKKKRIKLTLVHSICDSKLNLWRHSNGSNYVKCIKKISKRQDKDAVLKRNILWGTADQIINKQKIGVGSMGGYR